MRPFGHGIRNGVRRLISLGVRSERDSRLDIRSEIEAHIQARIEYLVARGVPANEAREESERRFGGNFDDAMKVLEASAAARARVLSRREQLALIAQDARFVLRGLGRAPAFAAGVVATLALGLGINSAVFRVADRVLVRAPDGVSDAGSLRRIKTRLSPTLTVEVEGSTVSYPEARRIADSRSFAGAAMYAYARGLRALDGRDIAGIYVDSGFFHTLGVRPASGRFFDAREAEVGAELAVAVVSYEYWQRAMGGVSLAENRFETISDKKYQIIGVTPRGFNGIDLDPVDVWLPLGVAVLGQGTINGVTIPWYRSNMLRGMRVIARAAPNTSDVRAAAKASAAIAAFEAEVGGPIRSIALRSILVSGDGNETDTRSLLLARLVGVAGVVLLIACANSANLLLARALRRSREIGIRLALGASRRHIVRLLIVESAVLGLMGGIAAAITGYWTGDALRRLIFPQARWTTAVFDWRTLVFTLGVAVFAGVIAGLAPAMQLTHPDLVNALKENRRRTGRKSHATRATLVVAQTALSLVLIIVSGLLVRSMQQLNAVNIGFSPDGLVTAEVSPAKFDPAPSASHVGVGELFDRIRRHPLARDVALSSNAPFGSHASMTVSVPGEPEPDVSGRDGPWYSVVSANFFAVMGTRVTSGRSFDAHDVAGSQPVAIVNQTMARLYWRAGNPFHSCLLARGMCARVIGVVEDIRDARGGGPASPRYYLHLSQQEDSARAVIVRTAADDASTVVAAIKASLPATQRATIEIISDRVGHAMRPWRVATMLFAALGFVALLLAGIGVYSVVSYIASERTHELGIRIALGATTADVVRLVLGSGLRLVTAGVATGLIAATMAARLLSSLLFGVSPLDAAVYVIAAATLILIGVAAAMLPALRVLRTDPTTALRGE